MLILTRDRNQTLYIGDDIKVTVLRVSYGRVYLGIDAPDDITILREELYLKARDPQGQLPSQKTGNVEEIEL
jgi:carbon storage regulator